MNSRERVIEAISHNIPDMIPIDFGASRVTGIHAVSYYELVKYLDCDNPEPYIYDVPQMLAIPKKSIQDYFRTDVVQLPKLVPAPAIGFTIDSWKPGTLPQGLSGYFPKEYEPRLREDGSTVLLNSEGVPFFIRSEGGYYFSRNLHPLKHVEKKADIDSIDFHEMVNGEDDWLKQQSIALRDSGRAVLGQFGGNFLERGNRMFGMEDFLVRMITEKPLVHYFFDKLLEASMEDFDRYLAAVEDRVDIIQLNDDLGAQDGPLISEEMYISMIRPYQEKLIRYIRSKSNMFVFLHSCGSIYTFIPHLIDIGVQILNPVQYQAAEMESSKLKKEFGRDITFWGGGCDAQNILINGTVDEVRKETSRQIDILSPGGGFVFAPVHNIQPGTPIENIIAMYEVIQEKRRY